MLASGAHVKIGDKEFRLDFSQGANAYNYSLTPTGEEVQYWLWDDWSGGEGNDAYDPADPIVYHQGLVNPRIPGKLQGPPARTSMTTGSLTPAPTRAFHAIADGKLYVGGEAASGGSTSVWYWDLDTLSGAPTEVAVTGMDVAVDTLWAMGTDGTNVWLVYGDTTSGDYTIRIITPGAAVATERNYADSNAIPITGIVSLGGYLYTWNGNAFRSRNLSTAAANTGEPYDHQERNFGQDFTGMTLGTDYWAGMVQGEETLYFFTGVQGRTVIYERDPTGAVGELWNLPTGFTGKDICYQSGALLVVGEYLGSSCLWGMSTISRQPLFLGFVRLGTDLDLAVISPGFGTEVLMAPVSWASSGGTVFVYDIAMDAFSQLDTVSHTAGELWSLGTAGGYRIAVVEDGDDISVYMWDTDDNPSATVDGRMESGSWDMDLPEDEKILDGIHVLGQVNSGSIDVYYQDDEDGTWTSAGSVTSGFHNYLPVSSTSSVPFRTLRVRVDPINGAEVYAVSARYRVNSYTESWDLLLDLTDEATDQNRGRRRRSHEDRGWQLRQYIRSIAEAKDVVTFLDGTPYPQGDGDDPDKYNTHYVVVDILADRIEQPGEGSMVVRLRSVEPV